MAQRRESVRLDLDAEGFTSGMARAAAATALLNHELDNLNGASVRANTSLGDGGDGLDNFQKKSNSSSKEVDKLSGRLNILRDALITIGPAAVPIGAVAVPAIVGLAAGLASAAAGAGVALLALHGFGDALNAIDKAQIEPTVENLQAMHTELQNLGPAGARFAEFLNALEPTLRQLQLDARAGFLPGAQEGIEALLTQLPELQRFIFDIGTELGRLSASAGTSLAGPAFEKFFSYLNKDGAATLDAFAHAIGNVTEGLASLLVAFAPLSTGFASGFEAMTRSFADWSAGLSDTQGFASFVQYVQRETPQVLDLIGSLATSFLSIAKAAAPVGDLVVPTLTALARVLGAIADSPIGPPLYTAAAAMIVLNRATQLSVKSMALFGVESKAASTGLSTFGKRAAGIFLAGQAIGALVNATLDLGNAVNASDIDRNLQAIGSGQTVGDLQTLASALEGINEVGGGTVNAIFSIGSSVTGIKTSFETSKESVEQYDQALASLVENGHADEAARAFEAIRSAAAAHGGVSDADVVKSFEAYNTALANTAAAAESAAPAVSDLREANDASGRVAKQTAAEIAGLTKAMEEQRDAALAGFDAETQYRQALKDAGEQAKKNDAGIRGNSDAALANRSALSGLAAAWNSQSDAVKNNTARFKDAKASFIDTATAMGVPIQKAKDLAKAILDIPKSRVVEIKAQTDPALRAIQKIKQEIAGIKDKDVRINAYVNLVNSANKLPNIPLPGEDHARGGLITGPGGPRDDLIPARLSNREYVVQADAVEHYGVDFFDRLNAKGYASGGLVSSTYASTKGRDPLTNLATQFGNLFAGYAADLGKIHDLTNKQLETAQKELTSRQNLLKQEVDRDKALTDATRQAMASLSDAIAGRFSSFDSSAQTSPGVDSNGNLSFNHNMTPGSDPNFNTDGVYIGGIPTGAQSYDDFVRSGLTNANDPNAQLAQIAETQKYLLQLLQALAGLGASKALLAFAGQNFSLAQLANLIGQGGAGVNQANHLLNQGNSLGQQAGNFTANAVYGAKLDDQIKEQRAATRELQSLNATANRIEKALQGKPKGGGPGGGGSGGGSGGPGKGGGGSTTDRMIAARRRQVATR